MIAEALMMAMTVWYVPGWMRTQEPQEGVMPALANAYPQARIAFKAWDGDRLVWPSAVASADREAERLAREIEALPADERERLVVVGHSLGGRIAARALARLAEKGLKIQQAVLLAAAIPSGDADLARMGRLPSSRSSRSAIPTTSPSATSTPSSAARRALHSGRTGPRPL